MLDQGLTLMLYGIGSVFLFLTLLVFMTTIMSKMVCAITPAVIATPQSTSTMSVDEKTLSVIRSAITQHRNKR